MKRFLRTVALLLACAILLPALASCGSKQKDYVFVEISFKNYGVVTLCLDPSTAPITVDNFVSLVKAGFYTNLTMHRVIKDFMIQGGDPDGNGTGGSGKSIKGEFAKNGVRNSLLHRRGVISMARSDNFDSASSQFFICTADSPHLNGKYAAFGWVVSGLSVVDAVEATWIYAEDPEDGVINDVSKRAVIEYIKVIPEPPCGPAPETDPV